MVYTFTGTCRKRLSEDTCTDTFSISKRPAVYTEGDQGTDFIASSHMVTIAKVCVCVCASP